MIKQENNDIESITPNIPRLAGNSPNLPIKPVVMNIKYVLRKGLEFYIFMIVKPLDILKQVAVPDLSTGSINCQMIWQTGR